MLLRSFVLAVTSAALLGTVAAQPTVVPPNFTVTQVTGSINVGAGFMSMAADRFGNVYVVEGHHMLAGFPPRVHRIRPDGTVDYDHATLSGDAGQLAYDPTNGHVYLATHTEGVQQSVLWRIDPAGGATSVQTTAMEVEGLAIDNLGRRYLGGDGPQGDGLYRLDPAGLTFLGPVPSNSLGLMEHWVLQSLVSGDVLVTRTNEVLRFEESTGSLVPFFSAPVPIPFPMPSGMPMVMSLARIPHNQLGSGALVAYHDFTGTMGAMSGNRKVISADLLGGNVATFATEPFGSGGMPMGMTGGMVLMASGIRNDTWWLTVTPTGSPTNPVMIGVLHKIEQVPAAGVPGSLFVSTRPGSATVNLYGWPGQPILFGAMPSPAAGLFAPPFGWIDLSILAPGYVPVFDGVGVFGSPDPAASIPLSGRFTYTFSYGALPAPLPVSAQALILAPLGAPNGAFYVSNLVDVILQ